VERQQLTPSQPGERRGQEQCRVLLARRCPDQREDLARWKMPWSSTSAIRRVFAERSTDPIHCSIIAVVIDSIGFSPNAGSSCERTISRYPADVAPARPPTRRQD
jgi:hypothetical protein